MHKGIELCAELRDVLAKAGLERDRRADGAPFDPTVHEAVAQDGDEGEPVVSDVYRTRLPAEGPGPAAGDGEGHAASRRSNAVAPQREWFEKDYYAVLGIQSGASDKEIQRAYRKLAKQYHPDANQGDAAAEERFKEISAAHEVLGDAEKRKEYDQVREMVASGVGPGGFGGVRRRRVPRRVPGPDHQLRGHRRPRRPARRPVRRRRRRAARRPAAGAVLQDRSAARTSRPSSTSTSSTRCTASRRR